MKCDQTQQIYWCIIKSGQIYLENGNLPLCIESELPFEVKQHREVGIWNAHKVFLAIPSNDEDDHPDFLPPIYDDSEINHNGFSHVRNTLSRQPYELFLIIAKARQFAHLLSHKFCSVCGGENELNEKEGAMQCTQCQKLTYPVISPCVIMAVTKEDRLLMACHTRHETNSLYTVLAGYVEIGESLEDCVRREVYEESGIKVKNIKYFASQPWPFPSQLMVAFTAEYDSGEIKIDPLELVDAKWLSKEELPDVIPPRGTVARELIKNALNLDI